MTQPLDQLSGAVERITYYNPENGYTIDNQQKILLGREKHIKIEVSFN